MHILAARLLDVQQLTPGSCISLSALCFAGSWILLLTALKRGSLLSLNTDLTKIANEMRMVAPDYFLNVPALLERMRKAVESNSGRPVACPY